MLTKGAVVFVFVLGALLGPAAAHADPIGIGVLSATYSFDTTFNSVTTGATLTTTATGSQPLSDSLEQQDIYTVIDPNDGSIIYSETRVSDVSATADWLAVSVDLRQSGYGMVSAAADFDLTFSPVADGTVTLGVDLTRSGEYGSGFGSLFDATTQQEVWRFSFGSDFGGCDICQVVVNEGGIESVPGWSSPFALPTVLNAADVYDLHLTASSLNPNFRTFSSIQVSGLVPVPESSTFLLLGTGLAPFCIFRRRLVDKHR